MQRLQKIIAQAGISSRRGAEKLIKQGRIRVNSNVVTEMGFKVNPDQDIITFFKGGQYHENFTGN